MTVFGIVLVLLLEQVHAAPAARVRDLLALAMQLVERHFNAGEQRHGIAGWIVGVALPTLLVALAHALLDSLAPLAAFLLAVAVLYFAMGFRQFSHHFTRIRLALEAGELDTARQLFQRWSGRDSSRLGSAELARLAIENGLLASHRHVFAPLCWFVALGPAGAALYRLADAMQALPSPADPAEPPGETAPDAFRAVAVRIFGWLDWLPVRLSATAFAIVGDFEDAVHCWRTQAGEWSESASGILLASGAGALGIRLGQPVWRPDGVDPRPELGLGEEAGVGHLQAASGLVWRALVLLVVLLVLLTLASWMGA